VVGRTKWSFYQYCTKTTSGIAMVNRKNSIVVVRLRRSLKKSWCGSWGVGYANEGNEGAKGKGETCKLLPLLNGRVRKFEDGTCIFGS
jgi:hypothetical protein